MLFLEPHVKKMYCFFNRSANIISSVINTFFPAGAVWRGSVPEDVLLNNHK